MKFKRLTAIFLAVLMLVSILVGCKKVEEDEEETSSVTTTADDGGEADKIKATLDLPEDLRYDGEEITMLIRHNEVIYHESEEGVSGDIVKSAVYDRNLAVKDRLGVTIKYENKNGFVKGAEDFQLAIRTASMSGSEGDYDLVLPNSFVGTVLITEDLYCDLQDIEYIDLDQPYWWKTWTENGTINGHTYSVTGDFNVSTLSTAQVVYFNKNLLATLPGMESPYDLMAQNNWTVSKLLEMSKAVTTDLGVAGTWDDEDRYGFVTNTLTISGVPTSCNIPNVTRTNDTTYEFTFASEKASTLVDTFRDAYSNHSLHFYNSTSEQDAMIELFSRGNVLFMWDYAGRAEKLKATSINYGILPTPKYDSDQESYMAPCTGQAACFILKTLGSERVKRAAAVLQTCGYYSHEIVTPAYFDTLLCGQATNDQQSLDVLNMLHGITYFGLTDMFTSNFSVVHWFKDCFMGTQSPQNWWAGKVDSQTTALENLISFYEGVQ